MPRADSQRRLARSRRLENRIFAGPNLETLCQACSRRSWPNTRRASTSREYRPLQTAFLAGAVTDAVTLFPMPVPSFAKMLWGFSDTSISYRFAMG